jgi:hypothetical protein
VKEAEEGGGEEPIDYTDIWLKAAGRNKGHVYGLGAAEDLYYDRARND